MQKGKRTRTRHHLTPKERIRKKTVSFNQSTIHTGAVLKLWEEKHIAWHYLFKNMTLDEIIECLERVRNHFSPRGKRNGAKVVRMNETFFIEKPRG